MSKLINKLNQILRGAPQPMGFGRTPASLPKSPMVLIASLSPANADRLADYVTGADAGLWHIPAGTTIKTLLEKSRAMPDIPWGCWLDSSSPEELESIAKANLDFVIFPATTALGSLHDRQVGRILQVAASLPDGLLRTINDLPVNAVLVTEEWGAGYVTWHHLMLFQRFASVLRDKPLLMTLPPKITGNELQALLEAGVVGVVAEAKINQTALLRQQIDKLSPPRRRRGRTEALLPRIVPEAEPVTEEEEAEP